MRKLLSKEHEEKLTRGYSLRVVDYNEITPIYETLIFPFFGRGVIPTATFLKMYERNPSAMRVVQKDSVSPDSIEQVGIICLLPVTQAAAEMISKGELSGSAINETHIVSGHSEFGYMAGGIAIGTRVRAASLIYFRQLLSSFTQVLSTPITREGYTALHAAGFVSQNSQSDAELGVIHVWENTSQRLH